MERTQEAENQTLAILRSETQGRSASTDALIRQWLFRFSVEHKEDIAPRLPLWLEAFGGMDAAILERLFSQALRECKFFPKVSEILEPMRTVKQSATDDSAERAWQRVLEIRRVYWDPDIPARFDRAVAKLTERVRQAARAAGVFREFTETEYENGALHTWAKKRFIESFNAWEELEQGKFLLPDGELKNLLVDVAATKALPEPANFTELHARGLEYAKTLNAGLSEGPDVAEARPVRKFLCRVPHAAPPENFAGTPEGALFREWARLFDSGETKLLWRDYKAQNGGAGTSAKIVSRAPAASHCVDALA